MEFPSRLRELRKQRKLTQEQLGQKIDVTKVSISCYENGTRTPDMETLQRLADALEVSVDYLLGRTEASPGPTAEQIAGRADDPDICRWLEELLRAPKESIEELRKIWEIIKHRGVNR
jgi:transcriptional regulator with XRE-family HTH domain